MITAKGSVMSDNYDILTDANKMIVDSFIDFLAYKQSIQDEREHSVLDSISEYENGQAAGPFSSVDELMADLYA